NGHSALGPSELRHGPVLPGHVSVSVTKTGPRGTGRRGAARRLGAVALLELLARAAPAGAVAAELLVLARADGLSGDTGSGGNAGELLSPACGRDRRSTGGRLVLVADVPV